jgi:hypothetical protein
MTKNVHFRPDSIPVKAGESRAGTFYFQKFTCAQNQEFYVLSLARTHKTNLNGEYLPSLIKPLSELIEMMLS